ncbi:hypothetical protein [Rhodococcus sp. ARC_M6]|uniref:hypothetical protein n=1 Tax=Rhodococcus sp. ARC_M6 TaxID=2928852 RepID=UPI001FB28B24|nr:hypothetical protein [Rhodococcus sp. ARC_M6]MCJ0902449.1 hypothetical protein [Rhodococcus sp. ARC_M6]
MSATRCSVYHETTPSGTIPRAHAPQSPTCYSEYTRHLDAGATALIIDSGPDQWLDLGHIPDNVDITITGQTCAAVTGRSITAAGQCFRGSKENANELLERTSPSIHRNICWPSRTNSTAVPGSSSKTVVRQSCSRLY